ncbi:hypothetical protein C4B60_08045 [Jeotgalibacillus proteolyticus]|uniref:Uncharacterized protein n=1 Tax=Jeotgalibacillus proteolyticus TaxID=2082395 RepID=A0A2S5GCU1_9BACL|nr:hypothetical protein C4B60_08045 [Jeotgalibacillus proteolyticus]
MDKQLNEAFIDKSNQAVYEYVEKLLSGQVKTRSWNDTPFHFHLMISRMKHKESPFPVWCKFNNFFICLQPLFFEKGLILSKPGYIFGKSFNLRQWQESVFIKKERL